MTPGASGRDFRDALISSALLVPMESAGLYGLGMAFERIVTGVDSLVSRRGADLPAVQVRFPPVLPFSSFQRTNYAASFPDLVGAIFTFEGDDRDHAGLIARHERGDEWRRSLVPSDLMLVSAACQPVFAMFSGRLPASGRYADILGYCFRHEASEDPMRMRVFRQREFVYIGNPDQAMAHREEWIDRGLKLLHELGLDVEATVANDPFFGRAGRILAESQRTAGVKTELTLRATGLNSADGVALASANYHGDHFGRRFEVLLPAGGTAHSACIGFGLERITLALLWSHGLDTGMWPDALRSLLCL